VLPFTRRLVGAKRTQQGSRPLRFSSEIFLVAMPTPLMQAEGSIRDDRNCEGRTEIAGVSS